MSDINTILREIIARLTKTEKRLSRLEVQETAIASATVYATLVEAQDGVIANKAIAPATLPLFAPNHGGELQADLAGNVRGAYAVDLQKTRTAVTQVASGDYSFVAGGQRNVASSDCAYAEGGQSTASGGYSHAEGLACTASGSYSHAEGRVTEASGTCAHAEGFGTVAGNVNSHAEGSQSVTRLLGHHVEGVYTGRHYSCFKLMEDTINNTPVLMAYATGGGLGGITVPSGFALNCLIQVTGITVDAALCAFFTRQCAIRNNAGTTALVGGVDTIGTDKADAGAAAWNVAITANNATDKLDITVQGAAGADIHWAATIFVTEVQYLS